VDVWLAAVVWLDGEPGGGVDVLLAEVVWLDGVPAAEPEPADGVDDGVLVETGDGVDVTLADVVWLDGVPDTEGESALRSSEDHAAEPEPADVVGDEVPVGSSGNGDCMGDSGWLLTLETRKRLTTRTIAPLCPI
jgi:hypothetical protein